MRGGHVRGGVLAAEMVESIEFLCVEVSYLGMDVGHTVLCLTDLIKQ